MTNLNILNFTSRLHLELDLTVFFSLRVSLKGVLLLIKFQIYTYSFTEKNTPMHLCSYEFYKTFQDGFSKRTHREDCLCTLIYFI